MLDENNSTGLKAIVSREAADLILKLKIKQQKDL